MDDESIIRYLVATRLAGSVSTTIRNTRLKIEGLFNEDPRCTFGLSVCSSVSMPDIERAMLETAGADLSGDEELGYIDPYVTLDGIKRHAKTLEPYLVGGGNILIATGHPAGLLQHYMALGGALERSGATVLRPLDDGPIVPTGFEGEPPSSIRFVGGVGCVYRKPGSIGHSHLPHFMESMLDELDRGGKGVDLVIGDHGMAGAATERGIPTMSIADVNDIPLQLVSGNEHHSLLVIDDNLPSQFFKPITDLIIERARSLVR